MVQEENKFDNPPVNQTGIGRQIRPVERGENREKGGMIKERLRKPFEPILEAREELGKEKAMPAMPKIKRKVEGRKGIISKAESILGKKIGVGPKPKIHLIEFLAMIIFVLIPADIAELLSLTGVGLVISWMVTALSTGILTIWLFIRKRRVGWNLALGVIEIPLGPIVSKTLAFVIFYILDKRANRRLGG